MELEHISIYTDDLEQLKQFYVRYFSGKSNEKYKNLKTGLETYFITFDGGARLELMQKPGLSDRDRTVQSYGLSHLAFQTGSREKVEELTTILVNDGYQLKSRPRETGDGYYESCILDPDGNEVEITA
jgi:lactoylglutathione lyase